MDNNDATTSSKASEEVVVGTEPLSTTTPTSGAPSKGGSVASSLSETDASKLRAYLTLLNTDRSSKERSTIPFIRTIVEECGCCIRCLLRFLEVRDFGLYQESNSFLGLLLTELLHQKDPNVSIVVDDSKPCSACFGCLQNLTEESLAVPLIEGIRNCGYEFKDYQLAVTVPPSVSVRHYALYYFLKDKFPDLLTRDSPTFIPEVKESFKWVIGPMLKSRMQIEFKFQSDFNIKLYFSHNETSSEPVFLERFNDSKKKKHQNKRTRTEESLEGNDAITITNKILREIDRSQFVSTCAFANKPLPRVSEFMKHTLSFEHLPVFVGGRYMKLVRDLSQTPWVIDGERKTEDSVEELISKYIIGPVYKADGARFSSAGREDVDVRMLGTGRPFTLEVLNPRRPHPPMSEFVEAQKLINTSTKVQVRQLQPVSKNEVNKLKEGEEEKKKTYRCIVWVEKHITEDDLKPINEMPELVLDQLTPMRVLHRRSLMNRKRSVYSMKATLIKDHFVSLELTTQAGTYVKEFIHGDLGRTNPNFGTLMKCETDILQLDVSHIDLDFPTTLPEH